MRLRIARICLLAAALAPGSACWGQHVDILVQRVGGKLTTGSANFDAGSATLGLRVFSRPFNSLFAIDDPGFNSIGSSTGTLPPGSNALPGGAALQWDFLPMKVAGPISNLMYWNASGANTSSVAFGPPPGADYSLSLFGVNDLRAAAGAAGGLEPGHKIATSAADGFIHQHRYFFLDNDHDDGNATVAAAGVYMASLRLRMAGVNRSEPLFVLFSTPSVSLDSLAAADAWARANVDLLSPSFSADFDGDLDVDGEDLLTWQRGLGATSALQLAGDADGDHAVSGADLAAWRSQFGLSVGTLSGAPGAAASAGHAVPEPGCGTLGALAIMGLVRSRRDATREAASGR